MSIFLTILSGTAVFILGQIVLKLFVEPWQQQRECIAQIAHHLLLYANVYSNPGVGSEEKNSEASRETRKLAAQLIASCHRIPFYKQLTITKFFPAMGNVLEVQKHLIGLSNSTHKGDIDINISMSKKIKSLLGIHLED